MRFFHLSDLPVEKQAETISVPIHETFQIAALLALVGGFLDAYTYLLRGGVFANAQTGNMVLLAVYGAQGQVRKALYCVVPILAFALGVFLTEVFKKYFKDRTFRSYEYWIIAIEILLLAVVGFLPASVPNGVVNVTISFVCSVQVNSFRKLEGITYASTMCTGNLRSGTEKLFQYMAGDQKAASQAGHYFGVIALFILGAAAGTILALSWGAHSIWCCCALLAVVLAAMVFKKM